MIPMLVDQQPDSAEQCGTCRRIRRGHRLATTPTQQRVRAKEQGYERQELVLDPFTSGCRLVETFHKAEADRPLVRIALDEEKGAEQQPGTANEDGGNGG